MKISELDFTVRTVDGGPRFGHFLIDVFLLQLVIYVVHLLPNQWFAGLMGLLCYPAYYIAFEYWLGYTPGKYITRTVVIDDFGNKPDLPAIILRTFIRFVPFEAFSCLGSSSYGWHDKWSNTYVVYANDLESIRQNIGFNSGQLPAGYSQGNKLIRSVIIVAIFAVVGYGFYFSYKKIAEFTAKGPGAVFEEMNKSDYSLIQGTWQTNWELYQTLTFNSDWTIQATGRSNTQVLRYAIANKELRITDSTGSGLRYFIMVLDSNSMLLNNLSSGGGNIAFIRVKQ